jgi:hypothetical protein
MHNSALKDSGYNDLDISIFSYIDYCYISATATAG